MTLTDFLLARVAEDEQTWRQVYAPTNPMGEFLLAECVAKRQIVEDLHYDGGGGGDGDSRYCACCTSTDGLDDPGWPCPTLRALALPYADHPDYRKEWAA